MSTADSRARFADVAGQAGLLVVLAAGCSSGSEPCSGVSCSSNGYCFVYDGAADCACFGGFHVVRLECQRNDPVDPCLGVDCAGHGTCRNASGVPVCDCEDGYHHPWGEELLCARDPGAGAPLCVPFAPEICDGYDNDCDGLTDESFDIDFDSANCGYCGHECEAGPASAATCILSECAVTCLPGWSDLDEDPGTGCEAECTPGTSTDETECEGRDDDCDGRTDEDWTTTVSCGEGFCERSAICFRGEEVCRQRAPPGFTDATLDGIDDDCDGLTDEDTAADGDADGDGDADAGVDTGDADADADAEADEYDAEVTVTDVPCPEAGDCSDDDPCTLDFCEGGTCRLQPRPSGFDCGPGVCCHGTCVSGWRCCEDGDCSVPACQVGRCADGECRVQNAPEGSDCMGGLCCGGLCRTRGNCCSSADCNDGDPCTADVCQASYTCESPHRPASDGTGCTGGICCSGTCVPGADCCTDAQCECRGTTPSCEVAPDATRCAIMALVGCSWDAAGPCEGTPASCDALTPPLCSVLCGCTTGSPTCSGTAGPCSALTDGLFCPTCGCSWDTEGPCEGTPPSCASVGGSPDECGTLPYCSWGVCVDSHCNYVVIPYP